MGYEITKMSAQYCLHKAGVIANVIVYIYTYIYISYTYVYVHTYKLYVIFILTRYTSLCLKYLIGKSVYSAAIIYLQ